MSPVTAELLVSHCQPPCSVPSTWSFTEINEAEIAGVIDRSIGSRCQRSPAGQLQNLGSNPHLLDASMQPLHPMPGGLEGPSTNLSSREVTQMGVRVMTVTAAKYFSEWVSNTVNRCSPLRSYFKSAVYSEQRSRAKFHKPRWRVATGALRRSCLAAG